MANPPISRGFKSHKTGAALSSRLPPGQYATADFPVLSAGPTPNVGVANWNFRLELGRSLLGKWSWKEFLALPQTDLKVDIHCVTKWSKFDTNWRGVTIEDVLTAAGLSDPPQAFTMAYCDGGYSTNVPVEDLMGGRALVATHYEGVPLSTVHGGPARLLVPHLYFWKSAKWVRGLRFIERDEPGFWESFGYHLHGDPWREQRYQGD